VRARVDGCLTLRLPLVDRWLHPTPRPFGPHRRGDAKSATGWWGFATNLVCNNVARRWCGCTRAVGGASRVCPLGQLPRVPLPARPTAAIRRAPCAAGRPVDHHFGRDARPHLPTDRGRRSAAVHGVPPPACGGSRRRGGGTEGWSGTGSGATARRRGGAWGTVRHYSVERSSCAIPPLPPLWRRQLSRHAEKLHEIRDLTWRSRSGCGRVSIRVDARAAEKCQLSAWCLTLSRTSRMPLVSHTSWVLLLSLKQVFCTEYMLYVGQECEKSHGWWLRLGIYEAATCSPPAPPIIHAPPAAGPHRRLFPLPPLRLSTPLQRLGPTVDCFIPRDPLTTVRPSESDVASRLERPVGRRSRHRHSTSSHFFAFRWSPPHIQLSLSTNWPRRGDWHPHGAHCSISSRVSFGSEKTGWYPPPSCICPLLRMGGQTAGATLAYHLLSLLSPRSPVPLTSTFHPFFSWLSLGCTDSSRMGCSDIAPTLADTCVAAACPWDPPPISGHAPAVRVADARQGHLTGLRIGSQTSSAPWEHGWYGARTRGRGTL